MKKYLLYISLLLNIILITVFLWPHSEEEKKLIQQYRKLQKQTNSEVATQNFRETITAAETLLKILSKSWEINVLKKNMSNNILAQLSEDELRQTLKLYESLGEFIKAQNKRVLNNHEKPEEKIVTMECEFKNGKGVARLVILKTPEKWLLEGINITSDVFINSSVIKK